jgi:hypothetical protein
VAGTVHFVKWPGNVPCAEIVQKCQFLGVDVIIPIFSLVGSNTEMINLDQSLG